MKKTGTIVAVLVFLGISSAAFTILPAGVRATTLYVGGGGPDNHTTIQGAIDAAMPGDTIFVYDGTYNERLTVDKTLTLVGESRDTTWINGGGSGDTIHVTADWVNLTGFFVLNGGPIPWDAGIELDYVQNCSISGNNFIVNDFEGVFLRSSHNNTIANNTVAFNVDMGISLLSSHNNTIIDNNVSSNGFNIALDYSDGNVIANNNASNSDSGIALFYSDHNIVMGNNASDNTNRGIFLDSSAYNRIEGNVASNNTNEGIHLRLSIGNDLSENDVSHSDEGILLWIADRTSLVNNTVSDSVYGIHVDNSKYGSFAGNVMTRNGFYLEAGMAEWNTHSIDTSNTVNGRPVRYWKNVTGGTVPLDAGQVILANCTGVTVESQSLSNATMGIAVGHSTDITIRNNILLSNSLEGILLEGSENSIISQNTLVENGLGIGIIYYGNNTITDNAFSLNGVGIRFFSSDENMVDNNTVSGSDIGIRLAMSDDNTFANNSISSTRIRGIDLGASHRNSIILNSIFSNEFGIDVWSSNSNTIHHNDFVGNVKAADDDRTDNQWDDGYPSGGNYWSDYTGVDLSSGPNQDQPGSDGIGDIPYDQIGVNEDRYPLMSPMTPLPPRPPRVTDARLSGNGLKNITLEWDLSPDDGSGLGSVVRYDIQRGSVYDFNGSGYALIASLPNGTSSFVDSYSGEGDPSNYFYIICALDLSNDTVCADDQAAKFTRPLSTGPNLVSIPLLQSNESIETVLQSVQYDKAWSYDSFSQEWKWHMSFKTYRRNLWSVNHTVGLWTNVTKESNLTVAGVVPITTDIHLSAGWNVVGFPSLNSSFTVSHLSAAIGATRVEGFDPLASPFYLRVQGDAEVLQAGYGYWVRVESETCWVVEFP
ncbi:MAG: nitrous oxide reductase family maturation protein NosD [Thermoplasmata archaeon]